MGSTETLTEKLKDMGLSALFGFVVGAGVVLAGTGVVPGPQERDSLTCGASTSAVVQRDMAAIERNFTMGSEMESGSQKFQIWKNRDSSAGDRTVVVARYPDGQVCYAPAPQLPKP